MISLLKRDYNTNVCHFAADTIGELDLLPRYNVSGKGILSTIQGCAVGSVTVVTETSDKYILNGERNQWVKISTGSGGGGSGDIDFATDDEVREILGL